MRKFCLRCIVLCLHLPPLRALLPLSTEALVSLPGKLYDECHTDESTSQKHSGETERQVDLSTDAERKREQFDSHVVLSRLPAVPNSFQFPLKTLSKAPLEPGDRAAHRQQPMPDVPGRPVTCRVPHRASDILGSFEWSWSEGSA